MDTREVTNDNGTAATEHPPADAAENMSSAAGEPAMAQPSGTMAESSGAAVEPSGTVASSSSSVSEPSEPSSATGENPDVLYARR